MSLVNFDVGNVGNMKNSNINENNEFGPNSNATRNVDNGTPDAKVSVPGGEKESPNSKPYDQHSVNVPGGDKHASTAGVKIPGSITLTDSNYNAALEELQKSFESGCVLLKTLREATVIPDSEAYKEDFTESAINDAFLEALENGALFEAVDRSDKKEIKKIVTEIRKEIKKACEDEGATFYKPAIVARLLTTVSDVPPDLAGTTNSSWQQVFTTRLWQVLGICHIESGNVGALQKSLTEKFQKKLGDYKILLVKTTPELHEAFKTKFNWKNNKGTYFMLVDKKLDSDIKKVIGDIKAEGNGSEEKEVKTESVEEKHEDDTDHLDDLLSESCDYDGN